MSKNIKIMAGLTFLEIFTVLISGFTEKGTENIYSGTPEYHSISYAFISLGISFLLGLGLITWLAITEAKHHPRKKYYPLLAAFALAILASVIWLLLYTIPRCGCGGA